MENSLPKYLTLTEDNIDKEHIMQIIENKYSAVSARCKLYI